jgi:hypothetical protein
MNKVDYFKENVEDIFELYFNNNFKVELNRSDKYHIIYSYVEKHSI